MSSPVVHSPTGKVLVVDDDPDMLLLLERGLKQGGFEVSAFHSAGGALDQLEQSHGDADVVFTDIHMPGMGGLELVSALRERWPDIIAVLMTGEAEVSTAVHAMRLGAYDYLVKPFDVLTTLLPVAKRAVEYRRLVDRNRFLQHRLEITQRFDGMVGCSAAMATVKELIASVAPTPATVLILGESGTGKELVARAIHEQSPRNAKAFVDVNCAALTETLLESELFGHSRGAFTGAFTARRGLFEEASGGTLFLDEIAELSPSTQARLLRVLQDGKVRPVGSNDSREVDVRVVSATNRDLERAVRDQRFRADLYYRLNVVKIELPPLRERMEDVPALAHHFLGKCNAKLGKTVGHMDDAALDALSRYLWPGNVRELENALERAIIVAKGDVLTADLLPAPIRMQRPQSSTNPEPDLLPMTEARTAFERAYVHRALELAGGSLGEAARLAGLDRSNFRRLVKRLG
jgi:two-component system response regulator HydG